MKVTVTTDSATIGIHQAKEPPDFTDSADDCLRVGIFPAGFACLVRGFFLLLNLQLLRVIFKPYAPWHLI
jgi:hypothetical protein